MVALGRIFDERKGSHSARDLLRFAAESNGIFSRAALEARKVRMGVAPQVAKEFAATAFEIRPGGLANLQKELEEKRVRFEWIVKPVRHQLLAHGAKITREERAILLFNLRVPPLEDLVVYTLRLHRALFQLYHNGHEPIFDEAPSSIEGVMQRLPNQWTNTWEHLHAAKNAAAFLDWIKRGAPLKN